MDPLCCGSWTCKGTGGVKNGCFIDVYPLVYSVTLLCHVLYRNQLLCIWIHRLHVIYGLRCLFQMDVGRHPAPPSMA